MFQLENEVDIVIALMTTGAYLRSENGEKLKRYDPDLYAKIEKLNMRLYKYREESPVKKLDTEPHLI